MKTPGITNEFLAKFPIDKKGYHSLPCVSLVFDNMEEWMKGLRVSTGLSGFSSTQGHIDSWDVDGVTIDFNGKLKKLDYDPQDIQLCVYQFNIGVVFNGVDRTGDRVLAVCEIEGCSGVPFDQKETETRGCEVQEVDVESMEVEDSLPPVGVYVSSYVPKNSITRS